MVFQDVAVPIHHFHNGRRFDELTAVGEDAVGLGHIVDGNAVGQAADGGCQVIVVLLACLYEGGNTTGLCGVQDFLHTHFIGQVNGGDVHGMNEGLFQCDLSAGGAAVVLRSPSAAVGLLFITYGVVG